MITYKSHAPSAPAAKPALQMKTTSPEQKQLHLLRLASTTSTSKKTKMTTSPSWQSYWRACSMLSW
jgi:hypothetical protein